MKSKPRYNKFITARMPSVGFAMGILASAALVSAPWAHAQITYTGTAATGTWSTTTNWSSDPAYPNGIGVEIVRTAATTVTVTQDIVGGVTVGTIRNSGDGRIVLTNTAGLTLNQDGAGAGTASIILDGTNALSTLRFGTVTLADNLAITQNNSNSTAPNAIDGLISGSGNVTFNNVMNDLARGKITFGANLNVLGTLTIASGLIQVQGAAPIAAANTVNLGVTGGSSASLIYYRTGNVTLSNAITVAATAAGSKNVIGSNFVNSPGTTTFSGNMTLNGDLTVTSQTADTALGVLLSGNLSGDGGLFVNGTFKSGGADLTTTGTVRLSGTNTFTGATTVSAGTLVIGSLASLGNTTTTIGVGGTLAGGGTIGGATTIQGTHNPGFSPGTQTFTNGLSYADTATLNWELTGNSTAGRGTSYDAVDVTGGSFALATGASIDLTFGGTVDFLNAFWGLNQEWLVVDLNGATAADSNVFSIGTVTGGANWNPSLGNFGIERRDGSTIEDAVYLTWTVIPEPSAALLGGLGLLVLLRRRRCA